MKKFLKILLGIIIVLTVIFFFHGGIMSIFKWDQKSVDESGLEVSARNIPKEENGYFDLLEINTVLAEDSELNKVRIEDLLKEEFEDDKRFMDIKTVSNDFLRERVEKNRRALDFYDLMVEKKNFQDDQMKKLLESQTNIRDIRMRSYFANLQEISKLKIIEALLLFREGNQEEAFQIIFEVMELGRKIEKSEINYLSLMYTENFLIENPLIVYRYFLNNFLTVENSFLKNNIQKINNISKNKQNDYIKAIKCEYLMFEKKINESNIDELQGLYDFYTNDHKSEEINFKKAVKNDYYYRPNETLEDFADYSRVLIDLVSNPYYSEEFEAYYVNKLKNDMELSKRMSISKFSGYKIILVDNFIGVRLYQLASNFNLTLIRNYYEMKLDLEAAKVLTAIKMNQIDGGIHPPQKLSDLEGKYMEEIPKDPFGGGELLYDREAKAIYSVGSDLKEESVEETGGDYVFEFGF